MIDLFPSRTVALELFGLQIHWYGLLYLAAFVVAWKLLPRLQRYRNLSLSSDDWSALLTAGVLGVLIGGRLGFVLFYEPRYFLVAPWEILAVWHGGMASHGGFLGVLLALWIVCRRRRIPFLPLMDIVVVPTAIGLALGRIGNFVNQELYGTVTSLPWAIRVPRVEGLRHPTQLYAVLKDIAIAGVCFWHLRRFAMPGRTAALFLILYGGLRFLIEELRDQPYGFVEFGVFAFSRGQLLTLPILLAGILVWVWTRRKKD